jgi:hypothetical protein
MKAIISRTYLPSETKGRLFVMDGEQKLLEMVTLELADNGNQHNTSCIPEGIYDCEKRISEKRGEHFMVLNVPGRTDILIHIGNYASGKKIDTKGCILPGLHFIDLNNDGNIDVADSTQAMKRLNEKLPEKFKLYIL